MRFQFGLAEQLRLARDVQRFLNDWQIDLCGDGELVVKPLGRHLTYARLFELVERLQGAGILEDVRLTFDCSGLHSIETPWTAVFALWLHLARQSRRGCRLLGLCGAPGLMAAIALRGVPDTLIEVEPVRSRDAA